MTSSRRLGPRISLNRNNEPDRDPFLLIPQYELKLNHFQFSSRFLRIPFACCRLDNRIEDASGNLGDVQKGKDLRRLYVTKLMIDA